MNKQSILEQIHIEHRHPEHPDTYPRIQQNLEGINDLWVFYDETHQWCAGQSHIPTRFRRDTYVSSRWYKCRATITKHNVTIKFKKRIKYTKDYDFKMEQFNEALDKLIGLIVRIENIDKNLKVLPKSVTKYIENPNWKSRLYKGDYK